MLIGRDPELARIEQLLAGARLGTSETLVLAGAPGMGKTALLEHAVERAQGMLVLRARGVESEAEIPFAGLHALLRPAFDRLDGLPQPQAAALRAALGLAPGVGGERFLIGAATLSLLAALAEERPVLVAVDDAQWLDESSFGAILFAARRLFADAVAIVIATRAPGGDLPTLALEGLDREASAEVLSRHAGAPAVARRRRTALRGDLGQPARARRAGRHRHRAGGRPAAGGGDEHRARVRAPDRARCPSPRGGCWRWPRPRTRASSRCSNGRRRRSSWTSRRWPPPSARGWSPSAAISSRSATRWRARPRTARRLSDERRAAHGALAAADADADRRAWHRATAALGHDDGAAR